jgi:nicotinamide mononucleotide transporter
MLLEEIYQQFISGMKQTTLLEYVAVFFGIASVWFSKKENILVFPVGLVNTLIYIYLSIKGNLFGEASVNVYYSAMSVYGWILWARKDRQHRPVVHITNSSRKEWLYQILFFLAFYVVIFACLAYLKERVCARSGSFG